MTGEPKLKIIQICAAYKPAYIYGGPTMSVSKLSEELVKDGLDVTVLATTANGPAELDVPVGVLQIVDGAKVFYFKRLTKDHTHFSPALLLKLHRLIKIEKKAGRKNQLIIHIHAWWNLVSIFSCWLAKLHRVKVILSPRGMLTDYSLSNRNSKSKDLIHSLIGKSLLKYSHIHATSAKEQKDVQQTCVVKGFSIIPNFVRFPKIAVTPFVENETYRLLFLSRIEEKKGLELLFEALANLPIKWRLTIGGTGAPDYIASLKHLAAQLQIENRIDWLGHVSNDVKFDVIANHDLLALTSYNENFANIIVESLAVGTPVLLSEEVGLADYVFEKDLGWIVPLEPNKITEILKNSYLDVRKRNYINQHAPLKIQHDFNEANIVSEYIDMYQQLN